MPRENEVLFPYPLPTSPSQRQDAKQPRSPRKLSHQKSEQPVLKTEKGHKIAVVDLCITTWKLICEKTVYGVLLPSRSIARTEEAVEKYCWQLQQHFAK